MHKYAKFIPSLSFQGMATDHIRMVLIFGSGPQYSIATRGGMVQGMVHLVVMFFSAWYSIQTSHVWYE